MPRRVKTNAERFWDKVQKTAVCWVWTAGKNNKGYGTFSDKAANMFMPIDFLMNYTGGRFQKEWN